VAQPVLRFQVRRAPVEVRGQVLVDAPRVVGWMRSSHSPGRLPISSSRWPSIDFQRGDR